MNNSNKNLGRTLIILGIGFIMLMWLAVFNTSIKKQDDSKNIIDDSSYFSDFEMDTLELGTFSNKDAEGYDIVIYNGWGPWCVNCVNEMPILEELSKEYKDKGILVVGIVADYYEEKNKYPDYDYKKEVKDVVDAYEITYPIVLANEKFTEIVKPTMDNCFPTTWVVDSKGNLIEYFIGGLYEDEWRELFDKLSAMTED